jgi:hypothetical protein
VVRLVDGVVDVGLVLLLRSGAGRRLVVVEVVGLPDRGRASARRWCWWRSCCCFRPEGPADVRLGGGVSAAAVPVVLSGWCRFACWFA